MLGDIYVSGGLVDMKSDSTSTSHYPSGPRQGPDVYRRRRLIPKLVLVGLLVFTSSGGACEIIFNLVIDSLGGCIACNSSSEPIKVSLSIGGTFDPASPDASFSTLANVVVPDPRSGKLFVGGGFSSADNLLIRNIGLYDPTTERWSKLPGGGLVNQFGGGRVHIIVIVGNQLYAGGEFSRTADGSVTNLNGIARYNIDTGVWSALAGNGLKDSFDGFGTVHSIEVSGTDMFVGGRFVQTFDNSVANLKSIARYNTASNTWSPLTGNGLSDVNGPFGGGQVNEIDIAGSEMIVGGFFSQTANASTLNLRNIARYNLTTNSWSSLGGNGVNGDVQSIARSATELFVCGQFNQSFDGSVANMWRIARYDLASNTWSALGGTGLNADVNTLALTGQTLYVGGEFTATQNGSVTGLNRIARYNTLTNVWSRMPGGGLDQRVGSLSVIGDELYVGGNFAETTDGTTAKEINGIVRFDVTASAFEPLGMRNGKALDQSVETMAAHSSGYLILGGFFTKSADGTGNLNRVARYLPATSTYQALANGGLNGNVTAVAISGDTLFVAGNFSATFDGAVTNLNRVARYDLSTNTWSPLGENGLNNSASSLAIVGDNLFVGGSFSSTFTGTTTNLSRMARYNITTNTWSSVAGNGLNQFVTSLAAFDNKVYVGGYFTATANGATTNLNRIARYDPISNSWSALSNNGLNSGVQGLVAIDGVVSVNGDFNATADGSITLQNLATYDTSSDVWDNVQGRADNLQNLRITRTALVVGNEIFFGGQFTEIDCSVSRYFSRFFLQQWKTNAATSDWFDQSNWMTNEVPGPTTNSVIPLGAGNISISSADASVNTLNMNEGTITIAAGRTLTINGTLNLNGGTIAGDGTLVIAKCTPEAINGGSPTVSISTMLRRCVNNTGAFTFPVSTANGYAPVTVKSVAGTGNVTVKAFQGAYSAGANGLPSNRLGRWWQIENPGGGITESDIFFNYLDSDITGAEDSYRVFRIAGGNATQVNSTLNTFSNVSHAPEVAEFSDWTLASNTGGTPTPTATPTPTPAGFEGDVAPRTSGDGAMTTTDVVQLRRFVSGLDVPNAATNEAQRADCAPFSTRGDGTLTSTDVVQGRRYASGLDPLTPAGGPQPTSIAPEFLVSILESVEGFIYSRRVSIGSASGVAGTSVAVPIEITPIGDEMALSFTLDYDFAKLRIAQITLVNDGNSDAVLTANPTTDGRLGVLIDYAEVLTASDEPRQIAVITFDIAGDANGSIPLDLSDSLTAISISNASGESLPVRTAGGKITLR